jgi:glycosyltransferase involved in cell wall biosynthesis
MSTGAISSRKSIVDSRESRILTSDFQTSDLRLRSWLVIPAFNVETFIGRLLERVLNYMAKDRVVVVDDGSTDGTAEATRAHGIILLQHSSNQGKGAALRTGFGYLLEHDAGWAITIDADLQHDPDKLQDFIAAAGKGDCDLVIGSRRRGGGMPWDRRFSNWCTSLLISLVTGKRITDSQSGYRLINCKYLQNIELRTTGYETETELLLKLCRAGAVVGSIDIPTVYQGESSSIRRFRDTMDFLKVVVKHLLRRI